MHQGHNFISGSHKHKGFRTTALWLERGMSTTVIEISRSGSMCWTNITVTILKSVSSNAKKSCISLHRQDSHQLSDCALLNKVVPAWSTDSYLFLWQGTLVLKIKWDKSWNWWTLDDPFSASPACNTSPLTPSSPSLLLSLSRSLSLWSWGHSQETVFRTVLHEQDGMNSTSLTRKETERKAAASAPAGPQWKSKYQ